MLASVALALVLPQAPAAQDLAAVLRQQGQRAATVRRVAPAVCAVMPVDAAGGGSGVVFDPAGFVLTNFHVVQRGRRAKAPPVPLPAPLPVAEPPTPETEGSLPGAERLAPEDLPWPLPHRPRFVPPQDEDTEDPAWTVMKVGLPDGELYLADVLGIDPGSDLAVLLLRPRPDGEPFPAVPLGDSDVLLVGETVFAMGNPFLLATDFTPTLTFGVVSGTHRYQPGGANRFLVYPDCIQTDAPVNPGNSGGPLFNEAGEVVGINGRISIRDRGRVNVGVGFAIASNQIKNFLGDLMAGRHAEHGTLDLNAWFMTAPGEADRRGVFVQATFEDSIPALLGVGIGDEITQFNGQEVRSANQLATLVGVLPAGSWVELGYRPYDADAESFGAERRIRFQLRRLDTGSSRDEDRLADEATRRQARAALLRGLPPEGAGRGGVTVELAHADGRRISLRRLDDRLRWDEAARSLVRDGTRGGFARDAAGVRDLSREEAARLERLASCCTLLAHDDELRAMVDDSVLAGGVLVFGAPAYRLALPGAGQREVYLDARGRPRGCRFRDPVARERVELRVDLDTARGAGRLRWVHEDGTMEDGWTISFGAPPTAADFARPPS